MGVQSWGPGISEGPTPRSVAWPQKQQLQRLGALQERHAAPEAAVAASRGGAGALQERMNEITNKYTLGPIGPNGKNINWTKKAKVVKCKKKKTSHNTSFLNDYMEITLIRSTARIM